MLIGELARRTEVSPRLLRYYEEQGLLEPRRGAKGYRYYSDDAPARVRRIRELLTTGLSTDDIRGLLPCTYDADRWVVPCDESLVIVEGRLAALDTRITELRRQRTLLGRQRDALSAWLAAP
ncbi:MerR family transcriptional regulator [Nocardia sp. NBC_00881]|uniref:MerR family transcriptional regulator n=1 Tax=Nocardia sp. NBC_00881 TaxID=2975995 RepID=UPI0038677AFD|nr:MerR family transcriptional regulator [Nocardia sp. NBC_00881]